MILGGAEIITRSLLHNLRRVSQQQQPCGVDLTLCEVSEWTSTASIDFDDTLRRAAETHSLAFQNDALILRPGAYLVDFNEQVEVPLNYMASIFPRSSLWRSGALVSAGVIDAGYRGALGALLEVKNPYGVVLYKDAKLAQIVFEEMNGEVEDYSGVYQGSRSSIGVNGSK